LLNEFCKMKVHIGEKIKQRSKELRIGPTELAGMINTSKQNIYGIFKRESIDTALLEKLGKALKYDFFALYINPKLSPLKENETSEKKNKPYFLPDEKSEFSQLKNQLMDLKEKYELLKKVNTLLEEKKSKRT
jgi:transcriptional regulator with XRE-family HTH domain